MPLNAGTRLGSFEIIAPLGAGGMGEVYRARDSRLAREVAIKVLPAAFAADVERMARFQREAQVLASLNHPNIAAIYGVEDSGGSPALVMELVEGPTLADRIALNAIPLEEALAIARQLAEALETAHEKGIIHRDLKPANIKVTPEGQVKVLDFGLAKALAGDPSSTDPLNSPTLTLAATRAGVILGTAAYMPPEQAKGKPVDRRADIWAFGVVLYEMLTGSRGYTGDTAAETLAAVMKDELDWSQLPASTPPHIRRLLKRCLQKDPKRRLRDMGEARIALDEPDAVEEQPQPIAPPPVPGWSRSIPWVAAALFLLIASAIAWVHFREAAPPERVLRYAVEVPEKTSVHSFAVSPDGRYLAIVARAQGKPQLWLRALDTFQSQPMPGTDGAGYPFWSPDSRYIGFFAEGKLKKVAASGGPPQALCDAPEGRGGSWNREATILFAPEPTGGLSRVSAAGGVPVKVTTTKTNHRFPFFLPDGRHFLYFVSTDTPEKNGLTLGSLDGQENRRLLADMSSGIYVPPAPGRSFGHILFIRDSNLMAQPFDDRKLQFAGDLFPIAERVSFGAVNNLMLVTASADGVLMFQSGRATQQQQIAWVDRSGKLLGLVGKPERWWDVALAPDEKSVAVSSFGTSAGGGSNNSDIWLYEFARGAQTRFTFHASSNLAAVWSPKGDRIAFSSSRAGNYDLFWKTASGAGQDEPLFANSNLKGVYDWSGDGRFLVYLEANPKTKQDLMVLPVSESDRKPMVFLQTEFNELQGQFSPDSHWMAYTSDESGRREIYVRPFPVADGKWKVSTDGGEEPRWRADGREIFFLGADRKLYAVPVKSQASPKPSFEPGTPVPLFDPKIDPAAGSSAAMQYDVTADGKRFLIVSSSAAAAETPISVVVNWLPKNKPE